MPKGPPPGPLPKETARKWWERVRRAETQLAVRLRKITHHIGVMVSNFPDAATDPLANDRLTGLLDLYGQILVPWAAKEGERIVAEVARRDERAWMANSREMAQLVRQEINGPGVGAVLRQQSAACADLITSLPTQAAQRIRDITLEARASGTRPKDLEAGILASGDVSASRARLIARTEVARTASLLTQTRAESIGCTHYIWRTVKDGDVRKSHRQMEGVVCAWADPPKLSDGTTTHAGQIYNCRCFPEPIFDRD